MNDDASLLCPRGCSRLLLVSDKDCSLRVNQVKIHFNLHSLSNCFLLDEKIDFSIALDCNED